MINDNREDFLPPVVMPPVRRDPNLGIERDRDRTPPFSAPSFSLPRKLAGIQVAWRLLLLAVLLAAFLVGIILILHAIAWVVSFLWQLT